MSDEKPERKTRRKGGRERRNKKKKQSVIETLSLAQKDESSWAKEGKNYVWAKTDHGAYVISVITEEDEDKIHLLPEDGSNLIIANRDEVFPVNPPSLERVVDMARLSYLNPPCVLHNLKQRYSKDEMYTYSGLFLVAINPYKSLPIYGEDTIQKYIGKRRNDVDPHVFNTADTAYRNMSKNQMDQSILVTGESGAGKTVNTKIIIQYLTSIAGAEGGGGKLSEQIKSTNPLLEAFGNAKTERNNNSSRFGKFIKINFDASGYIVGTEIVNYLLEITRVVSQSSTDRNFHIFYQILQSKKLSAKYKLGKVEDYANMLGENVNVEGMNDTEELKATIDSMTTIGFTDAEQDFCFSVTASLLHLGHCVLTEDKTGFAEIRDKVSLKAAAKLLGVDAKKLEKGLIKPDLVTPHKTIQTHATVEDGKFNIDALVKSIFKRLFDWIVIRINESLKTPKAVKSFIGVLDIAGFEIFDLNSFEQLCINYTNEKLQQFFNDHMFRKEQDEYEREQIEWQRQDYGDDLAPTIDLIEGKGKIMDTLDEQAFRGEAAKDKEFTTLLSKRKDIANSPSYELDRFDPMIFTIVHYADPVPYNVNHWLNKNKDPVNQECMTLMGKSKKSLVSNLFPKKKEDKKKRKKGKFQTISMEYRKQLRNLMGMLNKTEPHFVRCIKPNELKKPGILDDESVLGQLKCNGVLEGIRISRKGYPGRIMYEEFVSRYKILARKSDLDGLSSNKQKAEHIVKKCELIHKKEYCLGLTKVFFKAGQEARIEKFREMEVSRIIVTIQAACRGKLGLLHHEKLIKRVEGIKLIQNNLRAYNLIKDWPWWKLFSKARPLVEDFKLEQELKAMNDAIAELKEGIKGEGTKREGLAKEKDSLNKDLIKLATQIEIAEKNKSATESELDTLKDDEKEKNEDIEQLKADKNELDRQKTEFSHAIANKGDMVKSKDQEIESCKDDIKGNNREVGKIRLEIKTLTTEKVRLEAQQSRLDSELDELRKRLDTQDGLVSEMTLEKQKLDDELKELQYRLTNSQQTMKQIESQKTSNEQELNDLQRDLKKLTNENSTLNAQEAKFTKQIDQQTNLLNDQKEQVTTLTRSNRTATNANKDLTDKLQDLEQRKMHIEKDLRHNKGDAKDIEAEIEKATEDIETLTGEEKELKDDVEKLKKTTTETEDSKFNLKKENEDLSKKIDELQYLHKEKQDQSENEQSDLKRKIQDLEASLGDQVLQASNAKSTLSRKYDGENDGNKNLSKDFSELESELEDVRNQYARLETSFKSEQAKLGDEKKKYAELEAQRRNLNSKLAELESQLSALKEENSRLDQQRKTFAAQSQEATDNIESLEKDRDDLEADKNEQSKKVARINQKLTQNKAEETSLKNKLDSVKLDLKTANGTLNELNLNITGLKQKKKDLEEKLGENTTVIETERGKIGSVQKKLSRADDDQDKLKRQFDEIENKLKEEYEAKQLAENEAREKKSELESLTITEKALSDKNISLEKKLGELSLEVEEKVNGIQKLKTDISLLKSKNQLQEDGNDDFEVKIKDYEEQEKILREKLAKVEGKTQREKQLKLKLQTEHGKLKSQLEALKDLLVQNEQKDKSQYDSLKRKFETNESEFDAESKHLRDEIDKLKKENKVLDKQNKSNKQLGKGQTEEAIKRLESEYQKRIEKLRAEVASERKGKITAEAAKRNLDFQLSETRELIETEEKKRKKADVERKSLAMELDELRDLADEAEILQEELEELKSEAEIYEKQLTKEVEREQSDKQKAQMTIDKLKAEMENLKKKLTEVRQNSTEQTRKARQKFEKQITDMEDLITKAKKDKKEAVRNAKKLEKSHRSLKRKMKTADREKQSAIEKTEAIRKELSRLREQTSDESRTASRADTQNKVLTKEVNQLRAKQRELEDEIDKIREDALDGRGKSAGGDSDALSDDSDLDLSDMSGDDSDGELSE